jgi:hypothetical protein
MKNFRGDNPVSPEKMKDKFINKQANPRKESVGGNQGGFNHGSTAQFTSNEL